MKLECFCAELLVGNVHIRSKKNFLLKKTNDAQIFHFFQTTKFHFGKMFQQIIKNFNLFSHHSVRTSGSENYPILW